MFLRTPSKLLSPVGCLLEPTASGLGTVGRISRPSAYQPQAKGSLSGVPGGVAGRGHPAFLPPTHPYPGRNPPNPYSRFWWAISWSTEVWILKPTRRRALLFTEIFRILYEYFTCFPVLFLGFCCGDQSARGLLKNLLQLTLH